MAITLEKTMPEFWKKVGTKAFEIVGAMSLALFINMNSELNGLRSQVTDLHRYNTQLVPRDEGKPREQSLNLKRDKLRDDVNKNLKEWHQSALRIGQDIDRLTEESDQSVRAVEKSLGDLRTRLAALESRPQPDFQTEANDEPATRPTGRSKPASSSNERRGRP